MFWKAKECQACKVLRSENDHLRGLVDRLMEQVAPKPMRIDPAKLAELSDKELLKQLNDAEKQERYVYGIE